MQISNKLALLRAYKLQLDHLGYVALNGELKDRTFYREFLRTGKQEKEKQYSCDRKYQYNNFLNLYFNSNKFYISHPSYKEVIKRLLPHKNTKANKYFKHTNKIGKLLLKLKHIEVFNLFDGEKLIKDNYHNKMFLYRKGNYYRLTNGKCIKY